MIGTILLGSAVAFLNAVFGWLPDGSELPFGIHAYVLQFANIVRDVVNTNELFHEMWIVFLYALSFSIIIFTIEWVIKIWRMIRG